MILVKVELHSAITGQVSELGRMYICNEAVRPATERLHDYSVRVMRKGATSIRDVAYKTGFVHDYPRAELSMWRLVARAIKATIGE